MGREIRIHFQVGKCIEQPEAAHEKVQFLWEKKELFWMCWVQGGYLSEYLNPGGGLTLQFRFGHFQWLNESPGTRLFLGEESLEFDKKSTPNNINVYLKECGEKIYFYVSF